jgi:hypothetical protein
MGMTDEDRRSLKGGVAFLGLPGGPTKGSEPFSATIAEASRLSGLSRSELYRRLAAGDIKAIKSRARTLVLIESLRAHLSNLPAARFRAPKGVD